jgi:hypothetical protein
MMTLNTDFQVRGWVIDLGPNSLEIALASFSKPEA